jgi:hypothetical protein
MKITKATVIKLIVAALVPGGLIIWGLHEFNKYRVDCKKDAHDNSKTGPVG